MIFDLVRDFANVLDAMPAEHPRYRILKLLDEAIRRDVHFIDRHPTTLFQCLWNTCWWYDCSKAAKHFLPQPRNGPAEVPPWKRSGPKLSALLNAWLAIKKSQTPGYRWVRSLRPPDDPLDGGISAVLVGHKSQDVFPLQVSLDGRLLVTFGEFDTRVWDLSTSMEIACFKSGDLVFNSAFLADGRRIVAAERDGSWNACAVRVWEVLSGAELVRFETGKPFRVAVPDSRRLVLWSQDGEERTLDQATLACVETRQHHWPDERWLAMSADAELVLSMSNDGDLQVRGLHANKAVPLGTCFSVNRLQASFSADGQTVAVAESKSGLRVWKVDSGQEILAIPEESYVLSFALRDDGKQLVYGRLFGALHLWDLDARTEIACLESHTSGMTCIGFLTDGRVVGAAEHDDTVRIWDMLKGHAAWRRCDHDEGGINATAFSVDGRRLASTGDDCALRIWNVSKGLEVACFRGHKESVTCAAFHPAGQRVASGSFDGTIRIWDMKAGTELQCLNDAGPVECLAFSQDGALLASGEGGGAEKVVIRVWDLQSGRQLLSLPGHRLGISSLAFSTDGTQLVTCSRDDTLRVWELADGKARLCFRKSIPGVKKAVFSGDRTRVISWSPDRDGDGEVHLWDSQHGKRLPVPPGRMEQEARLAVCQMGTWRIRHDTTGMSIWSLNPCGIVAWYQFSPDYVVTAPGARTWVATMTEQRSLYLFTVVGRMPKGYNSTHTAPHSPYEDLPF